MIIFNYENNNYAKKLIEDYDKELYTNLPYISSYYLNDQLFSEIEIPLCSYIGSYCFNNCYSLLKVNFPNCSYLGPTTFQYCNLLSLVQMPKISYISNAFMGCFNLQLLYLSSCQFIDTAFNNCYKLQSIYLPACSLIDYTFNNCYNLSFINLPQCSYISYAFNNCSKLNNFSLPQCDYISNAFNDCNNLNILPPLNCSYISYAFNNCSNITNISFINCSTVNSCFSNCNNLYYGELPGCINFYNNFYKCNNLSYLSLPDCQFISQISGMSNLKEIYLPTCSVLKGTYNYYGEPKRTMFSLCQNLEYIYLLSNSICSIDLETIPLSSPLIKPCLSNQKYTSVHVPLSLYSNYLSYYKNNSYDHIFYSEFVDRIVPYGTIFFIQYIIPQLENITFSGPIDKVFYYSSSATITNITPYIPRTDFLGWTTNKNGTEPEYLPSQEIVDQQPKDDIILYPIFEENYFYVSFTQGFYFPSIIEVYDEDFNVRINEFKHTDGFLYSETAIRYKFKKGTTLREFIEDEKNTDTGWSIEQDIYTDPDTGETYYGDEFVLYNNEEPVKQHFWYSINGTSTYETSCKTYYVGYVLAYEDNLVRLSSKECKTSSDLSFNTCLEGHIIPITSRTYLDSPIEKDHIYKFVWYPTEEFHLDVITEEEYEEPEVEPFA